jgi:opacity protein-like surface antigen
MIRRLGLVACLILPVITGMSQGYAFGAKGGLTIGFQQWDFFDRDPLFKMHGAAFIETIDADDRFALYAQLGYHQKGSAIRHQRVFTYNGQAYRPPDREFQFNNASLILGAKSKFDLLTAFQGYYMVGIRGDYTLSTNLSQYEELNELVPIYPFESLVNKFNYGVTVGGGVEFGIADLVSGFLEISFHQDLSQQYYQPPIENIIDPFRPGQTINLRERRIINRAFEISLGIRFQHIIEYID